MPLLIDENIPIQQEKARAEPAEHTTRSAATNHDTDLYKRFLELPVPVVLLTLWLVGLVLVGFSAMALYDLALPWIGVLVGP
jgi:hypothetical protein